MQDLKEVTQDVHYENYRAQKLTKPSQGAAAGRREYVLHHILLPEVSFSSVLTIY